VSISFLLNAEFVSQLMAERAESVARRQFLAPRHEHELVRAMTAVMAGEAELGAARMGAALVLHEEVK
jgi:hypothetical protein